MRAGLAVLLSGFVEGPVVDASPVLLGETVLRLAATLGGADGTLMVLEDLHWSCADTLAVIEYLADGAATERLLIVGTTRPEGEVLRVIDSLERRATAAVRAIAPLAPAETDEMTASCLEVDPAEVPARLARVLESRAEGIPFLVEELLASIANSGALTRSASGWKLDGPLESVEVPLSFSQTIHERLGSLPPPQRRTLQIAATLGRDFDWSHLPRMTHMGEPDVREALGRAVHLQLVEDAGGNRFRFRHALTVDAILTDMLGPERARLAGEALGELLDSSEWGSSDLLELAAHLAEQSGRVAEAVRYLTEDARRALATGAVGTASATARRARDLLPADEPEAIAAAAVLLSALSQAGDTVAVDEVGRALLAQLEPPGDAPDLAARVRLLLARAAHAALELTRARSLCLDALALAPGDRRLRAELELTLAEIAFSAHEHSASVSGAERVLAEADAAGLDDLACDALELIARHRMFVELRMRKAEPILVEALERGERAGLPLPRLRVLQRLAFYDLATGAGRGRTEAGRALALELGALASAVEFDHVLATQYLVANELDNASACVERALRDARRYGLVELTVLLLALRATIAAIRGERCRPSGRPPRRWRRPRPCRLCARPSAALRSRWRPWPTTISPRPRATSTRRARCSRTRSSSGRRSSAASTGSRRWCGRPRVPVSWWKGPIGRRTTTSISTRASAWPGQSLPAAPASASRPMPCLPRAIRDWSKCPGSARCTGATPRRPRWPTA